jgi:hypothetical protein
LALNETSAVDGSLMARGFVSAIKGDTEALVSFVRHSVFGFVLDDTTKEALLYENW